MPGDAVNPCAGLLLMGGRVAHDRRGVGLAVLGLQRPADRADIKAGWRAGRVAVGLAGASRGTRCCCRRCGPSRSRRRAGARTWRTPGSGQDRSSPCLLWLVAGGCRLPPGLHWHAAGGCLSDGPVVEPPRQRRVTPPVHPGPHHRRGEVTVDRPSTWLLLPRRGSASSGACARSIPPRRPVSRSPACPAQAQVPPLTAGHAALPEEHRAAHVNAVALGHHAASVPLTGDARGTVSASLVKYARPPVLRNHFPSSDTDTATVILPSGRRTREPREMRGVTGVTGVTGLPGRAEDAGPSPRSPHPRRCLPRGGPPEAAFPPSIRVST